MVWHGTCLSLRGFCFEGEVNEKALHFGDQLPERLWLFYLPSCRHVVMCVALNRDVVFLRIWIYQVLLGYRN